MLKLKLIYQLLINNNNSNREIDDKNDPLIN